MNIHLNASSVEAAGYFADVFNKVLSNSRGQREWKNATTNSDEKQTNTHKPPVNETVKSAYEILGVPIGASAEQIIAAYRQMAKMYHPDRLATLAPEFIELAEERMKEINSAYETLKK